MVHKLWSFNLDKNLLRNRQLRLPKPRLKLPKPTDSSYRSKGVSRYRSKNVYATEATKSVKLPKQRRKLLAKVYKYLLDSYLSLLLKLKKIKNILKT